MALNRLAPAAISFSADGRHLGNIREDWRLSMNKSLALVVAELVAYKHRARAGSRFARRGDFDQIEGHSSAESAACVTLSADM
jgi:hypothetical protein